ncbi:MAG: PAS domain S-box protein [Dehalococcoidia bacterium]|jgi:two-component system phosphate regulon sensor histidine kinase PhoR|nr:PAS domain S-box protein [Dehalococcoidia bacterium]
MVEEPGSRFAAESGGVREHSLERLAARLGVRPSITSEWAWIAGRAMLVAVAGVGVVAFLRGTPPFAFMLWAVGLVLAYNVGLAGLLMKRRVHASFFLGLALDTLVLLLAWAVVVAGLAEEPEATDIYLIMFPIVVVAVIRLGWPLGVVQGTVFIVWMAATALWFWPADFYAVQQMPLRVLFLTTTMGLTLWLMARLNRARDEAEDLARERATLAEMSRVIGSTLELGQVYGHFASLVQDLVPYRRISMNRFDPVTGQLVHVYSHGESAPGRSPGSEADLSAVVSQRSGVMFGGESTGQHASMAAPLISGDRLIGTISTEAPADAVYSPSDLDMLERVAHQISSAIESSRLAEVLVSSETRLRSVLDSSQDAVITLDTGGKVTGANAGAVLMFGCPATRLEDMTITELVPSWPGIDSRAADPEAPGRRDFEVDARRSDGSMFPTEAVTAPLSGQEGSVITLRDITERKMEEDARMRVLQTVAHELRTPLSAVLGAKDLLTSTAPTDLDSFTFKRLMGVMERGVDRLDTLGGELTDLVDLIDMQRGAIQLDREQVRVSTLVDAALAAIEPVLSRQDQVIRLRLDSPGTELWVDHGRMVQVIHGLLMNAHRASSKGAAIIASGRVFNHAYEIRVLDEGPGVAPEDEPYIFDPYSRAAREDVRSNEVRGFRLAIARGFVEAHGGEIGFETSPEGSEFYFRIPLGRPAAQDQRTALPDPGVSEPAEPDSGTV